MVEGSPAAHHGDMTRTTNKQIVEDFLTALFTNGGLTAVDRYLDPGFINHDPPLPAPPMGRKACARQPKSFANAFPDWRSDYLHLIAEGDLVAEHFVCAWHPPWFCDR
jgi:predicted SnoaL-like aldol condensation-catalyzing enzyme